MDPQVVALHNTIQQLEMLNCWFLAQQLRIELRQLIALNFLVVETDKDEPC